MKIIVKSFYYFPVNAFSYQKGNEAKQMLIDMYSGYLEADYDNLRTLPKVKEFEINIDTTLDTSGTTDILVEETGKHHFVYYNGLDDKNHSFHLTVSVNDFFPSRFVRKYQFTKFGNYIYEKEEKDGTDYPSKIKFTFNDKEIEDFCNGNLMLLKNKIKGIK